MTHHITPDPTEEEVAAILAAIQVATPGAAGSSAEADVPRWRWSGRWWSKPIPARRVRPW
ncbi:MAG: hypothetical protein GX643_11515 [Acidimicrobiales bacterium]|nr:hypothetical protein [Acidimicrobiales bacterium]